MSRRWIWVFAALALFYGAAYFWWDWQRRDHRHDAAIIEAARRYGVHPALVKAVVWRESRFDAGAVGRAGELGLMQVREPTARDWAGAEKISSFQFGSLADPRVNTLAGTWYLSRMLARFRKADNPLPYALAAYNAGPDNARKWATGVAVTNSAAFITQIGFPGTRKYVETVMERHEYYRQVFPPPPASQ